MSRTAYVNGEFLPIEDAKISVLDRGFLFADGVYEVTAVLDGKLVDYAGHVKRLHRSLDELQMGAPVSDDELLSIHREMVTRNNLDEGLVYLQVTRGAADRDFPFPKDDVKPSLVLFTQAKNLADAPAARTGFKVKSVPDIRWARRDIKSVSLLAPVLAKQEAVANGCQEAWMVEDGHVTEGGSSNAYIVKGDTIITRPISNAILSGITRASVLRLAEERDFTLDERPFTIDEALEADEAFVTAASTFVMPVVEIDGRKVGGGQPGPAVRRLREIYIEAARESAI